MSQFNWLLQKRRMCYYNRVALVSFLQYPTQLIIHLKTPLNPLLRKKIFEISMNTLRDAVLPKLRLTFPF